MKNFQQNLLAVLALALCVLCAWQWNFQTDLRQAITKRDDKIFKLSSDAQNDTNTIKNMDAEIGGLQTHLADLRHQVDSNKDEIIAEKREVLRLQSLADIQSNEITQYQSITNELAAQIVKAYDAIKKQDAAINKLVSQRDEFVQKYNDSVKARNDLTDKYNALVERINKLAAQPAPPR